MGLNASELIQLHSKKLLIKSMCYANIKPLEDIYMQVQQLLFNDMNQDQQHGDPSSDLRGSELPRTEDFDMTQTRERKEHWNSYIEFPEIPYQEFQELSHFQKRKILSRNRLTSSDTYNRTMDYLLSKIPLEESEGGSPDNELTGLPRNLATTTSTYSLQLRRSPYEYLVSCGVEDLVEELTELRISRAEFEFAREHFKHTNVPFFNEELWRWVVEENDGVLPIKISGVPEGTVTLPGEPVLNITGPSEIVAYIEPYVHRVFYQTLVASKARAIVDLIGDPNRFIEVGKRGSLSEELHLAALKAMYVGGGMKLTSSDSGSALYDTIDTGTIGHRYLQMFPSVEEAFRHAIDNLDLVVLLVDLVDSYEGMDLAFRLKEENRHNDKRIWMRLDSGVILEQVRHYLTTAKEKGFLDPDKDKVIVEGIESLDDIKAIEEMISEEFGEDVKQFVLYGAGGLLVSDKTARSDASSGFKISEFLSLLDEFVSTNKFSNSPGKESYPGRPVLAVSESGERHILQESEVVDGSTPYSSLFVTFFDNGVVPSDASEPLGEKAERAAEQYSRMVERAERTNTHSLKDLRGKPSALTQEKMNAVRKRYGLDLAL